MLEWNITRQTTRFAGKASKAGAIPLPEVLITASRLPLWSSCNVRKDPNPIRCKAWQKPDRLNCISSTTGILGNEQTQSGLTNSFEFSSGTFWLPVTGQLRRFLIAYVVNRYSHRLLLESVEWKEGGGILLDIWLACSLHFGTFWSFQYSICDDIVSSCQAPS
jgi:hypothetical protein